MWKYAKSIFLYPEHNKSKQVFKLFVENMCCFCVGIFDKYERQVRYPYQKTSQISLPKGKLDILTKRQARYPYQKTS